LGSNDTEASDQTANRQVYKHSLIPVPRRNPHPNEHASHDHDAAVCENSRLYDKVLHLLDVGDGARRRDIECDDYAAEDAEETAHHPNSAQSFFKKYGCQHGTNDDAQCSHRCDENRIGEGVCDEVADLAYDHERHATPPPGVLQVSVALAGDLVVFLVRLEQAHLGEDEGDADEAAGGDGEHDTDRLVDWRPGLGWATERGAGGEGVCGIVEGVD
jgi:hypothetical protein